jgi:tRNA nucleotidyltransferase (CCA-adding enzyme)
MRIEMPKGARFIIGRILQEGYDAYLVGGSIRDVLLGKNPKDYDIATSATPESIIGMFEKTVPIGIKHGTVEVVTDDGCFDVTTFRSEEGYINKRYPENVRFIEDLIEDLRRRDITINALAYNDEKGLIDPFGGFKDLNHRLIRAVGHPVERFKEDALRILRAVRLATTLDFNIEESTLLGIIEEMDGLVYISVERIREEISNILMSENPGRGMRMLFELGLIKYVLPELLPLASFNQFNRYHDKDVLGHTLEVLDRCPRNLHVRLAALFHDSGKPRCFTIDKDGVGHFYGHEKESASIARDVLQRLKYDNRTIHLVDKLISLHMVPSEMKNEVKLKKFAINMGIANIPLFLGLKKADHGGKPDIGGIHAAKLIEFEKRLNEILERNDPLELKDLAVNGDDLKSIGIKDGRLIGKLLGILLENVLETPGLNTRERLLEIAAREAENDNRGN